MFNNAEPFQVCLFLLGLKTSFLMLLVLRGNSKIDRVTTNLCIRWVCWEFQAEASVHENFTSNDEVVLALLNRDLRVHLGWFEVEYEAAGTKTCPYECEVNGCQLEKEELST